MHHRSTRFLVLWFLTAAAGLLLNGCSTSPQRHPNPELEKTPLPATPSRESPPPQPSLTEPGPTPVSTPFPQTPAELARDVYGERVIETIRIPAINVWAPVVPVGWMTGEDPFDSSSSEWDTPEASVGWMLSGALPDAGSGNIILYGHNNIQSSVFAHLSDLKKGDQVILKTGKKEYSYRVDSLHILPVLQEDQDQAAYEAFLSQDGVLRLTLISCYPPAGNTHRVIVLASPAGGEKK